MTSLAPDSMIAYQTGRDYLEATIALMERKARLGRPMTVDEVADLLGWTEAEKAAHIRSLDNRPESNLDEAKARIAARTQ